MPIYDGKKTDRRNRLVAIKYLTLIQYCDWYLELLRDELNSGKLVTYSDKDVLLKGPFGEPPSEKGKFPLEPRLRNALNPSAGGAQIKADDVLVLRSFDTGLAVSIYISLFI